MIGDAPPHEEGKGILNVSNKKILETDYKYECDRLLALKIPVTTVMTNDEESLKRTFE